MKRFAGAWCLAVSLSAWAQQPTPEGDQSACDAGDGTACRRLGTAIVNGDLSGRSFDEGLALLKRACSYGNSGACADADRLLEQRSPPPPPPPEAPPPPPPPGANRPAFAEQLDEQEWPGSRFGVVGRFAAGPTLLSNRSTVYPSLGIGTGVRYSLRERPVNDTTFAPAIAVLLNGQLGGAGSYSFGSVGLEARLEFVAVSSGGLLQPFFNCWLSAGANTWLDNEAKVAPSGWVGVGFGWNLFAHRGTWPNTSLGISASGTISGVIASIIAAAIIGVLHTEVRIEYIATGDTALHLLVGIGF